jgi:signal transduction histidine kinase
MKAGAHEFLPKPFEPDDLRGIVRRGLDRRRLSRQTAMLGPEISSLRGIHMAVLVHQLKSPLASLRQCAAVVLSGYVGDIPDKARGMTEVIAKRADQMMALLNDWLALVRIEESEALSRRDDVDLDALLTKIVEDSAAGLDASAVTLHVSRSGGRAHVSGDAGMLAELFRNLVTNAIKYTSAGGTIRVFVETEGATWAVVRVVDDGPGIPPEEQERIFEPFYRGVGQREIPGDGLGLTISRRIARNHGGELMVRSAVGKGAEFRVVLPASSGAAEAEAVSA